MPGEGKGGRKRKAKACLGKAKAGAKAKGAGRKAKAGAKAKGTGRKRLSRKTPARTADEDAEPTHAAAREGTAREGTDEVLGKAVTHYRFKDPVEAYVMHYSAAKGRVVYVGTIRQTRSLRYKELAEQAIN